MRGEGLRSKLYEPNLHMIHVPNVCAVLVSYPSTMAIRAGSRRDAIISCLAGEAPNHARKPLRSVCAQLALCVRICTVQPQQHTTSHFLPFFLFVFLPSPSAPSATLASASTFISSSFSAGSPSCCLASPFAPSSF